MNKAKALDILRTHNEWRRGADIPMQDPKELGEAIDIAISVLEQEKNHAPAFEFPFDVPDNDGFIVFTPMDNQTIRRKLKLKKGEGVVISIRKEYEYETRRQGVGV